MKALHLRSTREALFTDDMFVPENETPGQPVASLDDAFMHALEGWPDTKHQVRWRDSSMTEPSSPRNSHAEGDNDSLRRKLRDSLTSALEMVVSKQLVKSVLGKTVEAKSVEEKLVLQSECKTNGVGMMDRSIDYDESVTLAEGDSKRPKHFSSNSQRAQRHVDGSLEVKVDDAQGRLSMVSSAEQSTRRDSHHDVDEVPIVNYEKVATDEVVEQAKGGIQLMEQARKVAWNVELHLFSLNGGVNKKYKEKARSLLFNLKDKSNPDLRARVFNGEINPEILVSMSAAELASKELCQWRIAKAEEFASMVVLTEADVDPRRIVKKTHKGEFQVEVEDIGFSGDAEWPAERRPVFPTNASRDMVGEGRDAVSGRIAKGDNLGKFPNDTFMADLEADRQVLSQTHVLHGTVEDESIEMEEAANDTCSDAPSMTSRGEDYEEQHESVMDGSFGRSGSVQDRAGKIVAGARSDTSGVEICVPPSLLDSGTRNLCKSPTHNSSDSERGNRVYVSKSGESHTGPSVWEGSLQLSGTRSVSIGGFYKSGVRLEFKGWPPSIEVKGRVKIGVLDKFLRDLQLSRSRAVTVLSLCPSDEQGDAKGIGKYLKEIADQYQTGDRAGFAEPKPGFELYILAPGSACLDLLSEDQKTMKVILKRKDEVLVGVVVWRRCLSEGLSSSKEHNQSCSVRKVTVSNVLRDSATAGNADSLHRKETPSSREGLSSFLRATSSKSLVNVSGNTSMHSTQSLGGSSDARDPQTSRDHEHMSPAPSGLRHRPSLVPPNNVTENAHGARTDSCFPPHWSYDSEYFPPGFKPQPKLSVPQARSAVVNVQAKQHGQDFQGSPSCSQIPGALVPDGYRGVFQNAPPGFWPKSAQFPTSATSKIHTVSSPYDDDLPEFNFDAEREVQQTIANHETEASKSVVLVGHDSNGGHNHVTELLHISGSSNRHQEHHDPRSHQPSFMEFQSIPSRFPSGQLSQGPSAVPPASLSSSCESWNRRVFSRGAVQAVMDQNCSRSMLQLNYTDQKNLSRIPIQNLSTCSWGNGHRSPGLYGRSISVHSGFSSSGPKILNGASHTTVSNDPRNSRPPSLMHVEWPVLPPASCGYPPPHSSLQPPIVNMVSQHRLLAVKDSMPSSPIGMPLPYQGVRRYDLSATGASDLSSLSPSSSKQVYSRSKRKMEPMERNSDKVRASGFSRKGIRQSRVQSQQRAFDWDCGLGSTPERGLKKWGRGSVFPARERSLNMDLQGATELGNELHGGKLLKRERERERDQ